MPSDASAGQGAGSRESAANGPVQVLGIVYVRLAMARICRS